MMLSAIAVAILGALATLVDGKVVVSTTPAQTMKGIGASGAWWGTDLFKYPENVRNEVADFLFGHDKLGLTSYRYNVGGGGVFVSNPLTAPETFYVSPGVYNWSADPGNVWFLRKAAEYRVPVLTAFVNSAPPAFTSNNRSCGGHIVDAMVPAFSKYIADVIAHFREEGVVFTHVSPMNEPDDGFNNGLTDVPCRQEGMVVMPSQRAAVVNALRAALDKAGLHAVAILADESSTAENFLPEAATWIPDAAASVGAVCHHQYSFSNDTTVAQIGAMGRNLSRKETWFTEICCFRAVNVSLQNTDPVAPQTFGSGFQPDMIGALKLGNLLHQSFAVTGDVHFDWWLALSQGIGCSPKGNDTCVTTYNDKGFNDGLLYYDSNFASNGNYGIYTTKRAHLLRHFAQFVRMGAVRHQVSGLPQRVQGLAFRDATGSSLILMNMGSAAAAVDISGAGLGEPLGARRTTNEADWELLTGVGGVMSLPAMSITTVYF